MSFAGVIPVNGDLAEADAHAVGLVKLLSHYGRVFKMIRQAFNAAKRGQDLVDFVGSKLKGIASCQMKLSCARGSTENPRMMSPMRLASYVSG